MLTCLPLTTDLSWEFSARSGTRNGSADITINDHLAHQYLKIETGEESQGSLYRQTAAGTVGSGHHARRHPSTTSPPDVFDLARFSIRTSTGRSQRIISFADVSHQKEIFPERYLVWTETSALEIILTRPAHSRTRYRRPRRLIDIQGESTRYSYHVAITKSSSLPPTTAISTTLGRFWRSSDRSGSDPERHTDGQAWPFRYI